MVNTNFLAQITHFQVRMECFSPFLCNFVGANENRKMKVKIQTMLGDIVVRLYDETPIHRDRSALLLASARTL